MERRDFLKFGTKAAIGSIAAGVGVLKLKSNFEECEAPYKKAHPTKDNNEEASCVAHDAAEIFGAAAIGGGAGYLGTTLLQGDISNRTEEEIDGLVQERLIAATSGAVLGGIIAIGNQAVRNEAKERLATPTIPTLEG